MATLERGLAAELKRREAGPKTGIEDQEVINMKDSLNLQRENEFSMRDRRRGYDELGSGIEHTTIQARLAMLVAEFSSREIRWAVDEEMRE